MFYVFLQVFVVICWVETAFVKIWTWGQPRATFQKTLNIILIMNAWPWLGNQWYFGF